MLSLSLSLLESLQKTTNHYLNMRSKSPEKRCRQKPVKQPSYRDEADRNPETVPQYFQITVKVLEARKLVWLSRNSANSYVIVVFGKKKYRTSIRRNMEDPSYREFFIFEQYLSIRDIQKSSLWIAVMEPRFCAPSRLIGESDIDLGAVWSQPHHQVFHKWVQLSLPRNPAAGAVGFLKVDISIIFGGDIQVMSIPMAVDNERVEEASSYVSHERHLQSEYHTFQAIMPSPHNDLLLPTGSEQQPANYIITVYGVFGLPSGAQGLSDNTRYPKLPTTYVRVSFCGLSAKTAVQSRTSNPFYCEQINIVEMFPNMSELITLEVCNGEGHLNRILASAHLWLGKISHDGENGFLPTFGPSLLHMYGTTMSAYVGNNDEGAYHRGVMLVAVNVAVPYYQQELRTTSVEPAVPLQPDRLWIMEDFSIFCPIFEVSMIDRRICGKSCGIAMTIGGLPTDDNGDEDFNCLMTEIRNRKLYYTGAIEIVKTSPTYGSLEFDNSFPVLQLGARLPDIRFRMYRNNMLYRVVRNLEQSLEGIERRFRNSEYSSPRDFMEELNCVADDTAGNILKFLDIIEYSNPSNTMENATCRYTTELDQKQLSLQVDEAEKSYEQLTKRTKYSSTGNFIQTVNNYVDPIFASRKDVKANLAKIKSVANNLRKNIFKTPEGWPDIVIWLLNNGSRVAYYRVPISEIIYSVIPEQSGRHCGRIQTICLKPLKCTKHTHSISSNCFCIAAKVEMILWMAPYRQVHAFENHLPKGYKLRVKDFDMCIKTSSMMLEFRAFIYRAKINLNAEVSNQTNTFVRVHALNVIKETKTKPRSMKPVWNQVIKIHKLTWVSHDRLDTSPPKVILEVFFNDVTNKQELVGRVEAQPVVDDRTDYVFAPKLQWYDMNIGLERTGQLLMSVQLLPIQETELKSTLYNSTEENIIALRLKNENVGLITDCDYEQLPANLIPKSTTYKLDVYWWGLRDITASRKPCVVLEIDEFTIKSDIVCERKCNCNFPNGKSSLIFQAPLDEEYSPPLNISLYDSSTFGRTMFLATNVVKNPNRYIVNWIPKLERDASLKSVSISSSDFLQVSQVLYIKKNYSDCLEDIQPKTSNNMIMKTKRSILSRLFYGCGDNEEEYALLPLNSKKKEQLLLIKRCPEVPERRDWWTRYYSSIQDEYVENFSPADKIVMYGSELEYQPGFSKFKDWCTTLKLYNGKKTGIPEKDDQLYCGFLKAGIAIYRWPPPEAIIAVSCNGVDLKHGFFSDYPDNEAMKFLVRVYIVKGINLKAKACTGRLDPYVAINCGSKNIGDRKCHIKDTLNPIFGKMYEFRCTLPDDYLLTVSLYDYETVPPDELIGSTTIDLEDRIYTKHRARIGLATEYNSIGPNKWRDCAKPSVILEELCVKNHLPMPLFPDSSTVLVNGVEYRDTQNIDGKSYSSSSEKKENICLNLLHKWHTFPICGHHLVPEHVETRPLYNSEKPGLELGRLQMWVDIFPLESSAYIPSALDISPPKLEEYELRTVIWDVQGIKNDDNGKKITDIYVRAWLDTIENAQYTDVHYCSEGDGRFNWRMIFHFLYLRAQKKLVRKEKGPFTEVEEYFPPIFVVQVLDSDSTVPEEFLATLSFDLNSVPKGIKLSRHCNLETLDKLNKINLFSTISIRAWWPLTHTNWNTGQTTTAGLIDLELTLLPKEKALLMPVGLGREPPVPLPLPKRTESCHRVSFCRGQRLLWQREHTLLAIAISLTLILLLCLYLGIPQKFWNRADDVYKYQFLKTELN